MTGTHWIGGTARWAITVVALFCGASSAAGLQPLRENDHVNDRLVAAQIGDYIRRTCPTISPRIITFLRERGRLKDYVLDLGYSSRDIDAFINSKVEQERVKVQARAYMAAKGVVEGDVESYCRLGREEIAARTITGSLLRDTR